MWFEVRDGWFCLRWYTQQSEIMNREAKPRDLIRKSTLNFVQFTYKSAVDNLLCRRSKKWRTQNVVVDCFTVSAVSHENRKINGLILTLLDSSDSYFYTECLFRANFLNSCFTSINHDGKHSFSSLLLASIPTRKSECLRFDCNTTNVLA